MAEDKNIIIAFLCDREQQCNTRPSCGVDCNHTDDVFHARNFVELVDGYFMEKKPKTRRGEWLWDSDNGYSYCNRCKAVSPWTDEDYNEIDCPSFCYNCGADMRGEETE